MSGIKQSCKHNFTYFFSLFGRGTPEHFTLGFLRQCCSGGGPRGSKQWVWVWVSATWIDPSPFALWSLDLGLWGFYSEGMWFSVWLEPLIFLVLCFQLSKNVLLLVLLSSSFLIGGRGGGGRPGWTHSHHPLVSLSTRMEWIGPGSVTTQTSAH